MLFSGENRSKVIKKINNLFISLKRKLVNTAKYQCVFIVGLMGLLLASFSLALRKNSNIRIIHSSSGMTMIMIIGMR